MINWLRRLFKRKPVPMRQVHMHPFCGCPLGCPPGSNGFANAVAMRERSRGTIGDFLQVSIEVPCTHCDRCCVVMVPA